ncbi:hypothetical protein DL96DRAFT_1637873 [Flagelloscypha sp. PMI_526]|nr:hypothetical protein DL96DRAFT_1637873 [Flagelloscypha sp. PMI_526]
MHLHTSLMVLETKLILPDSLHILVSLFASCIPSTLGSNPRENQPSYINDLFLQRYLAVPDEPLISNPLHPLRRLPHSALCRTVATQLKRVRAH